MSLSGYTETAGSRELENIKVLAGDSLRFVNLCAPAGPAGKGDEVSPLQGALLVKPAHHDSAVDD